MKIFETSLLKDPCGLHACLRHTMRLLRWAGYFPVQGLQRRTTDGTKFNLKSFYSIYCILSIIGQMAMAGFSLFWFVNGDITMIGTSPVAFYFTNLITALLFVRLAQQWPRLIKTAEQIEQSLTLFKLDSNTIKKTTIIAYVIMALTLVEHLLFANFSVKLIMECLHETIINETVIANYVIYRMPYIFNYIPYSVFNTALTEVICIQTTFLWSFTDVLTISFSIYITSYFQNLNKIIRLKNYNNTISWGQLREIYSKLVILVKEIDDQLSSFILMSFLSNMFFISLQLFNCLNRNYPTLKHCGETETQNVLTSLDYLIYYPYSFLFTLIRALTLSIYATNVHAAAQEPVLSTYTVSSSDFDQEVQIFQSQLRFTHVGLSGKFFYVTRNMVLKVIGIIITYELVLLDVD